MKKFAILTLSLCMGAMMLVGCGCMNTNPNVTTLPTNGETSRPTQTTTAPTTAPATMPTTDATEYTVESTGTPDGAMDEILGGSADDATGNTVNGNNGNNRSRGSITPRG